MHFWQLIGLLIKRLISAFPGQLCSSQSKDRKLIVLGHSDWILPNIGPFWIKIGAARHLRKDLIDQSPRSANLGDMKTKGMHWFPDTSKYQVQDKGVCQYLFLAVPGWSPSLALKTQHSSVPVRCGVQHAASNWKSNYGHYQRCPWCVSWCIYGRRKLDCVFDYSHLSSRDVCHWITSSSLLLRVGTFGSWNYTRAVSDLLKTLLSLLPRRKAHFQTADAITIVPPRTDPSSSTASGSSNHDATGGSSSKTVADAGSCNSKSSEVELLVGGHNKWEKSLWQELSETFQLALLLPGF